MATCNGAGEARLEGQRFRIVVLDEASQVSGCVCEGDWEGVRVVAHVPLRGAGQG